MGPRERVTLPRSEHLECRAALAFHLAPSLCSRKVKAVRVLLVVALPHRSPVNQMVTQAAVTVAAVAVVLLLVLMLLAAPVPPVSSSSQSISDG